MGWWVAILGEVTWRRFAWLADVLIALAAAWAAYALGGWAATVLAVAAIHFLVSGGMGDD